MRRQYTVTNRKKSQPVTRFPAWHSNAKRDILGRHDKTQQVRTRHGETRRREARWEARETGRGKKRIVNHFFVVWAFACLCILLPVFFHCFLFAAMVVYECFAVWFWSAFMYLLFVCGVGWAGCLLPRRESRSEINNQLSVLVASLLPPFCLRESRSEVKNQLGVHVASLLPPFCLRESRSEVNLMHISHRTLRICH